MKLISEVEVDQHTEVNGGNKLRPAICRYVVYNSGTVNKGQEGRVYIEGIPCETEVRIERGC